MTTIPMLEKELEQAYMDIKYYKNRIERLNNQLQQKEKIKKEVREYIEKYDFITGYYDNNYDDVNDTYSHDNVKQELLEILDKVD